MVMPFLQDFFTQFMAGLREKKKSNKFFVGKVLIKFDGPAGTRTPDLHLVRVAYVKGG